MSTPQYPSVELIQRSPAETPRTSPRGRRWKVFFGVLLVALAIGLAVVYGRTPVYRASVSVLTVKPKAVDMPSAAADTEHVAIQGRLLLGEELLGRLSQRLKAAGDEPIIDGDALRGMLSVTAVPETNLLELRAQGDEPELLQHVANEWAKVFEGFRLEQIEEVTQRTSAELRDEQQQLKVKIEAARSELLAFREAHDIVSLEREENRTLSQLRGLNNSLNKARERLVDARARKTTVDAAIARGETVVPREQKAEVARMKVEIERASVQLAQLRQRYTELYISRDPKYKELPAALAEKRQELAVAIEVARATVRDEAQQEVEAAQGAVAGFESQLNSVQQRVQLFTERFKEFKALEEGLAGLERLFAERAARLAAIEVVNRQKFPPIQIVEWAQLPRRPISPDYERDLAIALAAALALALFVTWLVEYLSGRPVEATQAPILGVRISQLSADALPAGQLQDQSAPAAQLSHAHAAVTSPPGHLASAPGEQLSAAALAALLSAVDPLRRAIVSLLLSGIAPHELPLLNSESFNPETGQIRVSGANRREFVLDAKPRRWIKPFLEQTQEAQSTLLSGLDAHLANAARAAGVQEPSSVTALALWYDYVAFLVRQGIDDALLAARVGPIPPQLHRSLMEHAPARGNLAQTPLVYTHPAFAFELNT